MQNNRSNYSCLAIKLKETKSAQNSVMFDDCLCKKYMVQVLFYSWKFLAHNVNNREK